MAKSWFWGHDNKNTDDNNDIDINDSAAKRDAFRESLKVTDSEFQAEKESTAKETSSEDSDTDDMDTDMDRGDLEISRAKPSRSNNTAQEKSVVPDTSNLASVNHGRELFLQSLKVNVNELEAADGKGKDGGSSGKDGSDGLDGMDGMDGSDGPSGMDGPGGSGGMDGPG